jgi:choline transport protein
MASVFINGLLGFGMLLTVLFCIGSIENALTPSTGFTFMEVFQEALDSNGFATGLTALLLVLFIFCAVAVLAATSRVTWAFARDEGLPGSSWIKIVCHCSPHRAATKAYKSAQVEPRTHLPLYSIGLSAVISMLLGLINIGSSVAFNAIVSLVIAAYFGSYMIPISIVIYKRLTGVPLQMGPWTLGKWGLAVNIFSMVWLSITWLFSFFPIAIPVTPESMNWSSTLWGALMGFGTIWYFAYQRKRFTGPAIFANVGKD